MTTANVDTRRETLLSVINDIHSNGDGEVFAEDVAAVMTAFNLAPILTNKVTNTLEEIIYNLTVADAIVDDPKWAYYKYLDNGSGVPPHFDSATAQGWAETYLLEAERGIKLILGLTALS